MSRGRGSIAGRFGSGGRRITGLLGAAAAVLALAGIFVVAPVSVPSAAAAQPSFDCESVYAVDQVTHELWRIDPVSGTRTPNGVMQVTGTQNTNALALPPAGGAIAWTYNRDAAEVVRYDAATETTTAFPTGLTDTGRVVAGAIDPTSGIYYFATGGSPWRLYAFDTARNTLIGQVATIGGLHDNGDMAFDAAGTLYAASNSGAETAGVLARIASPLPRTAGTVALVAAPISDLPRDLGLVHSFAVHTDGTFVIGDGDRITRLEPEDGTAIASSSGYPFVSDLASCAYPNRVTARTNLPDGRAAAGDQFRVALSGPGIATPYEGATEGDDAGPQEQTAETTGAALAVDGSTYTATLVGDGATRLDGYATTWQCTDRTGGTVLGSGEGATASVTVPTGAGAADVLCEFTVVPLAPAVSLDKRVAELRDVAGAPGIGAGDQILWAFDIVNRGEVVLVRPSVDDEMLTAAGIAVICPQGDLAVGATVTCAAAAPYTVTEDDARAGQVRNVASASAGTAGGGTFTSETDETVTTVAPVAVRPGVVPEPDPSTPPAVDPRTPSRAPAASTRAALPATGGAADGWLVASAIAMSATGATLLLRRRKHVD